MSFTVKRNNLNVQRGNTGGLGVVGEATGPTSPYADRLQTQPDPLVYSFKDSADVAENKYIGELSAGSGGGGGGISPGRGGKTSIDPTVLLSAIDEQEGVTRRTSNWPYRTANFLVATQQPEIHRATVEEKFDRFIAERTERHSQYFAILNMIFVLYGLAVLVRSTVMEGAHSYVFITVEVTECRLNRLIWMVRITCIVQALLVVTLKAYLVNNDELKRRALLRLVGDSSEQMKRQKDSSDQLKFIYVAVQMAVFLLATGSFIYADCTQSIVTLDHRSPRSLYGILLYNLQHEYKYEWDAGPHLTDRATGKGVGRSYAMGGMRAEEDGEGESYDEVCVNNENMEHDELQGIVRG